MARIKCKAKGCKTVFYTGSFWAQRENYNKDFCRRHISMKIKKETLKPIISIVKQKGEWKVRFTIGHQGFFLDTEAINKKEAKWFAKMLKSALMNLYDNNL